MSAVEALAAAQGGLIALAATMPIETIQKTQVALQSNGCQNQGAASARAVAERLLRDKGFVAFYRGAGVLSAMVASEKFGYYLVYHFCKSRLAHAGGGALSMGSNLVLGYLSDIARLPLTMPLDLLSTRMQTSTSGSLARIFNDVLRTEGVRGFYSGWQAYFVLALKPAIQIFIFERLKARLNRRAGRALDASLSFGQAFCAGALARLVATLLCYPFFFARISAQAGGRGGMRSVMSKIWREQGLGGLYTGLSSELARGVIFHAVNMGCLEMLRATNSRLLTRS